MGNILERKLEKNEEVDHINNNGLDNRRCNLRLATRQQQNMNRKKLKGCSSRYKGVYWAKNRKKWCVRIEFNAKVMFLGYFESEIKAGKAYDEAAIKYFGEFARLNFDEKE